MPAFPNTSCPKATVSPTSYTGFFASLKHADSIQVLESGASPTSLLLLVPHMGKQRDMMVLRQLSLLGFPSTLKRILCLPYR